MEHKPQSFFRFNLMPLVQMRRAPPEARRKESGIRKVIVEAHAKSLLIVPDLLRALEFVCIY